MRTGHKFALALGVLVTSALSLGFNGWFGLGVVIALPVVILLWFDLGRELRSSPPKSSFGRVVGLLMGIPQALFGVICLVSGVSIVCWVLYNSVWERDPHYTGGFLTFGLGPVLALFGLGLVVDAFKRTPPSNGA